MNFEGIFRVIAAISLIFYLGCTSHAKRESPSHRALVSTQVPTESRYVMIEFEKGKSKLTETSKLHLQELNKITRESQKKIEDIKILAWADKEYPKNISTATTPEIMLAKERAKNIEDYLKKVLKNQEQIDLFNMAKRPNLLSRLFDTEDYQIKKDFEKIGTTAVQTDDGSLTYTKASKALVIIDYDGPAKK